MIYRSTYYGVYRSLDRGSSWSPIGAPKPAEQKRPARRRAGARRSSRSAPAPRTSAPAAAKGSEDVVKRAQEALNAAGYNVGTPDGHAGTRTVSALRGFQADRGIPISGTFDEATLAALGLTGGVQTTTPAGKLPVVVVALSDVIN